MHPKKWLLNLFFLFLIAAQNGECRTIAPLAEKQTLIKNRSRTDLLNYLISQRKYTSYLEIGLADGENLRLVKAQHKVGVDPSPAAPATYRMTSDEFFRRNTEKFDIVFIDGLHLYEQVLRDVENALTFLNPGGIIVMHDCMPATRESQGRTPIPGAWNGDVWKAAAYIRMHFNHVNFCVLDMDHGCGVLSPGSGEPLYPATPIEMLNWEFYWKNRRQLLNIVSLESWLSRQGS